MKMEDRRIEDGEHGNGDDPVVEPVEDAGATLEKNVNLDNIVLALLFAAEEPLSIRKLAAVIEDAAAGEVKEAVERWRARMEEEAWSVGVERVGGGYRLATRPDFAPYVSRLYSGRRRFRLSKAGLETLAIVAYKQPVTRADIESIRGVACGGVIANLMERSLVKITGKARVLGAPFLYGTTPEFLEYLGLNSLKDLPSIEELEALLEKEAFAETATDGAAPDQVAAAGDADADEDAAPALAGTARLAAVFDEAVRRPRADAAEPELPAESEDEVPEADEGAQTDVPAD
ncbi:MAG: SMC-Scp complex subunit ScpB [Candidatus Krumholzibacteria bacterium]|nr:SMC-Scp complex subunit ScpB [Candidatus Krumholzibacteria bacterium]